MDKLPNFDFEWDEAKRYPELEKLGKEKWIELAEQGSGIRYSKIKHVLNNVDLDFDSLDSDKKERFEESFKLGVIEAPIVLEFNEDEYDLLGGNTRLAGCVKNKINPIVWVVKMNKEEDLKETGADSSGAFEGAAFGQTILKRDLHKFSGLPNTKSYGVNESEQELEEDGIQSSGSFDVPAFGKTTKGGRRDPLKIDGPDSIYKGRAVTDKKWPRFGGPKGVYVKVKEKCKKFPYCNQGNTGAIEFIHEDEEIQTAIKAASKKYGISLQEVEKIVLNDIKQIFIKNEG